MKILLVLPLGPWYKGGVENVVNEVSKELKKNNLLTLVCTDTKLRHAFEKKIWNGIPVIVCKSYVGIFRISPGLVGYIRKHVNQFDILVIHNYSTLLPAQILAFRKEITVPIVFTPHFHAKGSSKVLQFYRIVFDKLFRKFFIQNIDAFQFVSKTERIEFTRKFPIDKPNKVIYNGINITKFHTDSKEKLDKNEIILLFVGRLEKYKNIGFVIKSLTYLPDAYKFYIIGEGPYKSVLEKLIDDLQLEKRIRLLGQLNDNEYVKWINKADLFIQPSTIESFGLTVLEALASGVKCIVNTNSYGLMELQYLFKNEIKGLNMVDGKEHELAELIKQHNEEEEKNKKIIDFDWANQAKKIEYFYQKIVSKPKKI